MYTSSEEIVTSILEIAQKRWYDELTIFWVCQSIFCWYLYLLRTVYHTSQTVFPGPVR